MGKDRRSKATYWTIAIIILLSGLYLVLGLLSNSEEVKLARVVNIKNLVVLGQGVMSGIIAALVLWLALGRIVFSPRSAARRFADFFGTQADGKLIVALSNAKDWSKCADGTFGEPEKGICSFTELSSFNIITNTMTKLNTCIDVIKGFVDSFWATSMPDVVFECSQHVENKGPSYPEEIRDNHNDVVIVVGSTNKNSIRRHYVGSCAAKMKFSWELGVLGENHNFLENEKGIPRKFKNKRIPKEYVMEVDKHNCITITPATGGELSYSFGRRFNLSIIEKHTPEDGAPVFFCNGVRADDSFAAVKYLFENWMTLHKVYGCKDFAICVGQVFDEYIREPSMQHEFFELISIKDDKIMINHNADVLINNTKLKLRDILVEEDKTWENGVYLR